MTKGLHKDSLGKIDNPHQWMIDDARMELIQQIKAEVNKLPEKNKGLYKQFGNSLGFIDGLDMVKKILSDLEKEEKPSEGLEEEITEFIANKYEVDYYDGLKHNGEYLDTYDVEEIARHFAQWQKEQTEKRWLEDREGCFWDGVEEGKKAMREQMMKGAVEGKVFMSFAPGHNQMVMADVDLPTNTKVRIIIVKED